MRIRSDLLLTRSSKPLSPHPWTSAPTATPTIRRGNDWQFFSFSEPWTLQEDWEEKKDPGKRNRYAPVLEFFNYLQKQGWTMIHFNFTRLGFAVRSPMWIVLSLSLSCPRSRRWASHRGSISRKSVRWWQNAPSRLMT
jgi:hypothetical protein